MVEFQYISTQFFCVYMVHALCRLACRKPRGTCMARIHCCVCAFQFIQVYMYVYINVYIHVTGRGGQKIRELEEKSGARIKVH